MVSKKELVKLNKLSKEGLSSYMFQLCPSNWNLRLQYARKISEALILLKEHKVKYPKLERNIDDYINGLLD